MVPFVWYVTSVILTSIGNVIHSGIFNVNPVKVDSLGFELPLQTECSYAVVAIHL